MTEHDEVDDAMMLEADERGNASLAAGALFAVLSGMASPAQIDVKLEPVDGLTQLIVRFPFLKSAYRVDVVRIPDTEEHD